MIRMATEADLPRILEIYAPYVLNTTISFEYEVPTLDTFTQRFLRITEQFPWLVWEDDGIVMGYAYASLPFSRPGYRWCAEPSIYLHPDAQGKGIGRSLYAVLEQILTLQGYRHICSIVTGENTGSLKFHEKTGYTVCGVLHGCGWKFGRNLDVVFLEKRTNLVEIPTNPPVSCRSIVKNDRIFLDILATLSLP